MNWMNLLIGLLPMAIKLVDEVHTDLAAHHKVQLVADIMNGAAAGVANVAPKYAQTAADAAAVATAAVQGTAAVVAKITGDAQTGPGLHTVVPE